MVMKKMCSFNVRNLRSFLSTKKKKKTKKNADLSRLEIVKNAHVTRREAAKGNGCSIMHEGNDHA